MRYSQNENRWQWTPEFIKFRKSKLRVNLNFKLDPVSGLKIQIQIQHSWIFHFLELKFSWISNFLEFTFSWIAIFVDWNFFEMKSSWIQTFFNENSFKKMWIQEDFNPENFESRKMKNSGMLDLNLHFKHCTWIWTSNSDWSWVSTSWTWRTQEFKYCHLFQFYQY